MLLKLILLAKGRHIASIYLSICLPVCVCSLDYVKSNKKSIKHRKRKTFGIWSSSLLLLLPLPLILFRTFLSQSDHDQKSKSKRWKKCSSSKVTSITTIRNDILFAAAASIMYTGSQRSWKWHVQIAHAKLFSYLFFPFAKQNKMPNRNSKSNDETGKDWSLAKEKFAHVIVYHWNRHVCIMYHSRSRCVRHLNVILIKSEVKHTLRAAHISMANNNSLLLMNERTHKKIGLSDSRTTATFISLCTLYMGLCVRVRVLWRSQLSFGPVCFAPASTLHSM